MIPGRTSELAASLQYSHATIMAELAAVLHDCDARITNIESAIARTRIPVQEICARFGGTRELILAMVAQLSDSMSASLTIASTKPDLRLRLLEFARCVSATHASPHWRALYRIAVTESIRNTDLGQEFHDVGAGRLTQRLADFLKIAQAEGALGAADPHLLAGHFLALLRDRATSAGSACVQNVVDLFCRGINGRRSRC